MKKRVKIEEAREREIQILIVVDGETKDIFDVESLHGSLHVTQAKADAAPLIPAAHLELHVTLKALPTNPFMLLGGYPDNEDSSEEET